MRVTRNLFLNTYCVLEAAILGLWSVEVSLRFLCQLFKSPRVTPFCRLGLLCPRALQVRTSENAPPKDPEFHPHRKSLCITWNASFPSDCPLTVQETEVGYQCPEGCDVWACAFCWSEGLQSHEADRIGFGTKSQKDAIRKLIHENFATLDSDQV